MERQKIPCPGDYVYLDGEGRKGQHTPFYRYGWSQPLYHLLQYGHPGVDAAFSGNGRLAVLSFNFHKK